MAYSVVLVPPEEVDRAREVAERWEVQNREDTRRLMDRLKRVVVSSLVFPVGWLIGHSLAPSVLPRPSVEWLAGLWVVSFVVVAQVENRRHRRERVTMPGA